MNMYLQLHSMNENLFSFLSFVVTLWKPAANAKRGQGCSYLQCCTQIAAFFSIDVPSFAELSTSELTMFPCNFSNSEMLNLLRSFSSDLDIRQSITL